MIELNVVDMNGVNTGSISLNADIFGREYNEALVHQVLTAFAANARSGNRAQKTRATVSHSTRKPFKQKGTGRARAGMSSSPIWRGGGRAFPNSPDENFSQKVNRKMYRAAMASILSKLITDTRLVVAEQISVDTHKTKEFVKIINNMSLSASTALIIVDELTEELFLASRNLTNILVLEANQINPYILVRCQKVLFAKKAIEQLQEQLV